MPDARDRDAASDVSLQARGWARVGQASSRVYGDSPGPGSNAQLFDAIAYAATQARLDIGELVDAYLVGAPQLDIHEAWDNVEDYLQPIADVDAHAIAAALARVERALRDRETGTT
jgi:hypothetical protein